MNNNIFSKKLFKLTKSILESSTYKNVSTEISNRLIESNIPNLLKSFLYFDYSDKFDLNHVNKILDKGWIVTPYMDAEEIESIDYKNIDQDFKNIDQDFKKIILNKLINVSSDEKEYLNKNQYLNDAIESFENKNYLSSFLSSCSGIELALRASVSNYATNKNKNSKLGKNNYFSYNVTNTGVSKIKEFNKSEKFDKEMNSKIKFIFETLFENNKNTSKANRNNISHGCIVTDEFINGDKDNNPLLSQYNIVEEKDALKALNCLLWILESWDYRNH